MKVNDVIIIGGGPAGISAAVQLKRFGLEPVLIERKDIGGLVKNAYRIDNYPGFPNGINGKKISALLKKHISRFNIKTIQQEVINIEYKNKQFEISTEANKKLYSKFLILACGTIPKKFSMNLPKEIQSRIFYEVYPLLNIKNQTICIIGSGDAAFDYALSLSKNNKVNILNRSSNFKCLKSLYDECRKNKNIRYFPETEPDSIVLDKNKLIIKNNKSNKTYKCDYILFAIGREPDTGLLKGNIKKQYKNLVKMKKLYIVGDMNNPKHRQTSISTGEGIKSAMEIFDEINKS
jgi:thioredoxin reductase (NADPH)